MSETTSETGHWNLSLLYAGPDDPAWEADFDQAETLAAAFRERWRGQLNAPAVDQIAAALTEYAQLQSIGLKPYFYSQLFFAAESGNPEARKLTARARERWNRISDAVLFFELALVTLPEEIAAPLLADPGLDIYRHYLQQLRSAAPYTLSEEVEQALKRKDLGGKDGFSQLFDEITAEMRFTFSFPGEDEARECSGEELLALLYHPDAAVREAAFATFLDGHAEQATVLTACFNNILLDHSQEAELRGYPELITPTHLANETDSATIETLLAVSEANYPLAQEYFALKKELLGLPGMKNTDLYAPLTTSARRYSLDEARELVLAAFAGFAPQVATLADAFFAEERIDPYPAPGKSGGAFCHGMIPGLAPYILINHTGTLRDVSTLAHELGHGIHFALAQPQNIYNYNPTLPLAETASVFAEMLLTRHLLDQESDPEVKIGLLCAKIEEIIATTCRQTVLTRFELAAHRLRQERLLAADDLCRLWLEENARLFGDAVTMIEAYRWGWSYISHFIHARFYCYAYVYGELVTLALYRRYQQEGAAFVPKYLDLLAAGGSAAPQNLFAPFAIRLDDPAFWQGGYDILAGLIAELRGLLAGR